MLRTEFALLNPTCKYPIRIGMSGKSAIIESIDSAETNSLKLIPLGTAPVPSLVIDPGRRGRPSCRPS